MPRLFVKSEGLKRRVRLMKASNRVGRAENSDVLLPHESVSELHAEITFDGEQWSLQDMGSTNGTIVDGNHLRRTSQPLRRNSLIGVGALHVIFLCVDARTAAQDRREEERALNLIVRAGRLTKGEANQIRRLCRADTSQSIAETLMMETGLKPVDWASAVATARAKVSMVDRILGLFSRR
ncbi:MAG: FHA domain-containing protein [Planctomycetes bacterium]|nr:FHA domain-containing protein [Planctomycetota bacterium]